MSTKTKNYDIIIIGSGPAGLSCAAELSDSNLKVAVISKFFDFDKFDVKLTSFDVLKELSLERFALSKQNNLAMYSKNNSSTFKYDEPKVCVIDFYALLKELKKKSNAEFITAEVIKAVREPKGVKLISAEGSTYSCKLLIDCSGTSFIGLSLIPAKKPAAMYQCLSVIFENCKIPVSKLSEVSLYMDNEICNSAVWFYPIDRSRCQLGLGDMAPYAISDKSELHRRLLIAKGLYPYKAMLKGGSLNSSTMVYCHNPVIQPIEKMQADNVMIAGDAAGMATPLAGDGVRPALLGGRNAATVAKEAFSKSDFSAGFLKKHEELWWERLGKYYIWTMLMRHFVCLHFKSEDWDEVVKNLENLGRDVFWEIICSRMTRSHFYKLMDFKILEDVVIDVMKKNIPHLSLLNKRHFTSVTI